MLYTIEEWQGLVELIIRGVPSTWNRTSTSMISIHDLIWGSDFKWRLWLRRLAGEIVEFSSFFFRVMWWYIYTLSTDIYLLLPQFMSICFNVKITSREILIYIVKVLYPTEKSNIISQTYIIVPPISIESQIPPKLVCCNPNQIATKISVPAPDSHRAPNELHVMS